MALSINNIKHKCLYAECQGFYCCSKHCYVEFHYAQCYGAAHAIFLATHFNGKNLIDDVLHHNPVYKLIECIPIC